MTDDHDETDTKDSQESFQELLDYICDSNTHGEKGCASTVFNNLETSAPSIKDETNYKDKYDSGQGLEYVNFVNTISLPEDRSPAVAEKEPKNEHVSYDSGYNECDNNHKTVDIAAAQPLPHVSEANLNEIQAQTCDTRVPSKTPYLGPYGFTISFEDTTEHVVKNANYTHSRDVQKLFAKMNVPCPVHFHCEREPPPGLYIRAMMLFLREDQSNNVVSRCPSHKMIPDPHPLLANHILRVFVPERIKDNSRYETSTQRRDSVIVPYIRPAIGEKHFPVLYKFLCRSSCVGGINRRPVVVVFTLEDQQANVYGRCCFEVKICSSPGRDRKIEENRKRKADNLIVDPIMNPLPVLKKPLMLVKESKTLVDVEQADDIYFLKIKGKENFELLSKINDALSLASLVTEEQHQQYAQQESAITMREILSKYFSEEYKQSCAD